MPPKIGAFTPLTHTILSLALASTIFRAPNLIFVANCKLEIISRLEELSNVVVDLKWGEAWLE
jgi:hypothetical protein